MNDNVDSIPKTNQSSVYGWDEPDITFGNQIEQLNKCIQKNLKGLSAKGEITDLRVYPEKSFFYLSIDEKTKIGGNKHNVDIRLKCKITPKDLGIKKIENGMVVRIKYQPYLDAYRSETVYRVYNIEIIETEGLLKQRREQLFKELSELKYFDEHRKRKVSYVKNIGLITTYGKVRLDFYKNLKYFDFNVYPIIDTIMEGQSAIKHVVDAINTINQYNKKHKIDIITLIRGGGNEEGFDTFNSREIADAIFHSDVPIICGLGHEENTTIADMIADYTVSTPTAVADTLSQDWKDNLTKLETDLWNYSCNWIDTLSNKFKIIEDDIAYKSDNWIESNKQKFKYNVNENNSNNRLLESRIKYSNNEFVGHETEYNTSYDNWLESNKQKFNILKDNLLNISENWLERNKHNVKENEKEFSHNIELLESRIKYSNNEFVGHETEYNTSYDNWFKNKISEYDRLNNAYYINYDNWIKTLLYEYDNLEEDFLIWHDKLLESNRQFFKSNVDKIKYNNYKINSTIKSLKSKFDSLEDNLLNISENWLERNNQKIINTIKNTIQEFEYNIELLERNFNTSENEHLTYCQEWSRNHYTVIGKFEIALSSNIRYLIREFDIFEHNLLTISEQWLKNIKTKIAEQERRLEDNDHDKHLRQGYCVIINEQGGIINDIRQLKKFDKVKIESYQGTVYTTIEKINIKE